MFLIEPLQLVGIRYRTRGAGFTRVLEHVCVNLATSKRRCVRVSRHRRGNRRQRPFWLTRRRFWDSGGSSGPRCGRDPGVQLLGPGPAGLRNRTFVESALWSEAGAETPRNPLNPKHPPAGRESVFRFERSPKKISATRSGRNRHSI